MKLAIIEQTFLLTFPPTSAQIKVYPMRALGHDCTVLEVQAVGLPRTELTGLPSTAEWVWRGDVEGAKRIADQVLAWVHAIPDLESYFPVSSRAQAVATAA